MNFFQRECYLHARAPRIKRDDGRVRLIPPSWSGKLSGFTLLLKAFLIEMCRSMPVYHVSNMTNVSDYRLWTLLENYITLFVDLEEKKTVCVTDGKGSETVREFTVDLQEHNGAPEQIKQVSCDMSQRLSKAYGKSFQKQRLPLINSIS